MPTTPRLPEHRHILRAGREAPVPFRVKTFKETGYEFPSRRRTETRVIVNHATGAENAPSLVYKNMGERRDAFGKRTPLSVHFVIDKMGTIYQMADADARCVHAGDANAFSIGIEIIGRLSDFRKVPHKGVERLRVQEYIHGQLVEYDELLPSQVEAAVRLNEALCRMYGLPLKVPETELGTVLAEQLTPLEQDEFSGCTGHLHWHPTKADPGLKVLRAIQERGRILRA